MKMKNVRNLRNMRNMKNIKCISRPRGGSFGYFLGFIGAAIYYVSNSTGFWNGVLGVLKALVWPAFLVYNALKFLGV